MESAGIASSAPMMAKPRRFKTIVPPPRVAEIAGKSVTVEQPRRRVAVAPHRQLPLHWRVKPRSKGYSLGTDPLTAKERALSKRLRLHLVPTQPRNRSECRNGPRPCPWVGCSKHLYLDVNPESGSIKLNHPDMELEELEDTCSLDVADRYQSVGGTTLEHVGLLMGITLERTRQIETDALKDLHLKLTGERRDDDKDDDAETVEGSDDLSVTDAGSDESSDWEDDECP